MIEFFEGIKISLGMSVWTLLTLIIVAVCVIMFIVHAVKQKNRNKNSAE